MLACASHWSRGAHLRAAAGGVRRPSGAMRYRAVPAMCAIAAIGIRPWAIRVRCGNGHPKCSAGTHRREGRLWQGTRAAQSGRWASVGRPSRVQCGKVKRCYTANPQCTATPRAIRGLTTDCPPTARGLPLNAPTDDGAAHIRPFHHRHGQRRPLPRRHFYLCHPRFYTIEVVFVLYY